MSEIIYRRATELMEADVGEELVALDPDRGECFGFNEVARDVWRALETPQSFDALRERLLVDYDVSTAQCEQDLRELLQALIAAQLIEERR